MIDYDSDLKEFAQRHIQNAVDILGWTFNFIDFFVGLTIAYYIFPPTISKILAIIIGITFLVISFVLMINASNVKLEACEVYDYYNYKSTILSNIYRSFVTKAYIGTLICYIISPPHSGNYINITYAGAAFFISGTVELLRYFNEKIKPTSGELDY